jgi:hypothetical protein
MGETQTTENSNSALIDGLDARPVVSVNKPEALRPVLAKITVQGDLGMSTWYEVVYHNGDDWKGYSGGSSMDDGETVVTWKYVEECF